MSARLRSALVLMLSVCLLASPGQSAAQFFPDAEPTNSEVTFGCNPGPVEPLEHADPPVPPRRSMAADLPPAPMKLIVPSGVTARTITGNGFNLEHTLWSSRQFRRILGPRILEPLSPRSRAWTPDRLHWRLRT